MLNPTLALTLAAQHERDLQQETAGRRLVALARCCRPSEVARALRALRDRWAPRQTAACCA